MPRGTTSAFRSSKVGFPIRRSTDQSSLAAPRGLSQLTTSFIASQRQGIHQMPLRHLIALIIDAHPSAEEFHADDCLSARIWESTHSEKRPFTCFTCFANHPRMWVSIIDTPATIAGATTKTIVYTGCPAQTFGWFALFTMRNSGVFRRGSIGSTAGNGRIPSDERRQEKLHKRGCARGSWWSQTESNRRPPACKAGALPTELWPRIARGQHAREKVGGPGKI